MIYRCPVADLSQSRRAARVRIGESMKQALASLICGCAAIGTAAPTAEAGDASGPATVEAAAGAAAPSGKPATGARARRIQQAIAPLREQLMKDARGEATGAEGLSLVEQRCAIGILYAHAGELARGQLHLAACERPELGEPLRERGSEAQAAVARALRKSTLSPIDISTTPVGWVATVEDFPEGVFVTPIALWLPAGPHRLHFAPTMSALRGGGPEVLTRELTTKRDTRGTLFVEAPAAANKTPRTEVANFNEEVALEPPQTTRPAPEKHRPLIPPRYGRGLNATAEEVPVSEHRGLLAVQLGGGRMAPTDGSTTAAVTRIGVHGRAAFAERWFLEIGLDWAHHFEPSGTGAAMQLSSSGDAFGALLGARVMLWRPGGLSLLAAARGRIEREADTRGGAELQLEGKPLPRWPLAIGASVELENGLTTVSAFAALELWKP
jgi:hypothetical protein